MNNFKKFFNKKVINIGIFVIVLAFVAIYATSVKSSNTDNISGYMWSADNWTDVNGNGVQDPGEIMTPEPGGAGWISINCKNNSSCAGNNYGVTLETDGDLVGYAWSPHFGWLKFGNLDGFPIGTGTTSDNAKVIEPGTSGCVGPASCVVGWARFCAGTANPNTTCTGSTASDNTSTGGWDGWVSLSGLGYGVTLTIDPIANTGDFDGYAWGGNKDGSNLNTIGTGWIAWDTEISGVIYVPDITPYVLLSANPDIVQQDGKTTLTWEGYGLITGNNACKSTAVEPIAGDSGWVSTPPAYNRPNNGTFLTEELNQLGTHTFTIECNVDGPGGGTVTSSVDVTVGINLNFIAEPSPAPYDEDPSQSYRTDLFWNVLPADTQFTSCTAVSATDSEGNNVSGTGWPGAPILVPPSSKANIFVPVNPTFFTISCVTPQNVTITKTIPVARGAIPASDIILTWSDPQDTGGGVFTTTLEWSTQHIVSNSCKAWAEIGGTTWDVPVNKSDFGSQSGVIVSLIPVPEKTTFRLTCDKPGSGTISEEVEINAESDASRIVKPHYKEN